MPSSSKSTVPKIEFLPEGLKVPTESEILSAVQSDIDSAFGGGLNLDTLETPQGQLASSETAIIGDKNDLFAYYITQIDPRTAKGRMQDAIGAINWLKRDPGRATSVICVLNGARNTVIPKDYLIQDQYENIYKCKKEVVLDSRGMATAEFINLEYGPIPCPKGTLNRIYQALPGLDTVNNPADGLMGTYEETRWEFEQRRKQSVALNAHGTNEAIEGAVLDIKDVREVYVIDNDTSSTVEVGPTKYPVVKNSIYVAVVGGDDLAIATAIRNKKAPGCNYNGNTSVIIYDPSGYYPPKTVKFERPNPLPIKFVVNIVKNNYLPNNIITLIRNSVIDTFNGVNRESKERIGSLILSSSYFSGITQINPNIAIISIFVGTSTVNLPTFQVGIDQYPTISESDIMVHIV